MAAAEPLQGRGELSPAFTQNREVNRLIDAWNRGERDALGRLISLILDDLRDLAQRYMARESSAHTLQPTALVHEAYLRLAGRRSVRIANRVQLFAVLAETMRRILVDHGRRKKTVRHGGGVPPVPLDEVCGVPIRVNVDLVELDDALKGLASVAPRQHEVVQLNYFAGLNHEEIATLLEVSPVTVKRDLKVARIWLLHELRGGGYVDGAEAGHGSSEHDGAL